MKIRLNEFIWRVSNLAKGRYRLDNTSDLLVLYFLKFVSDNKEGLDLNLSNLQNFNILARTYGSETNNEELICFCKEVEFQLNISQYGISNHLDRLLNSITDIDYLKAILNYFLEQDFRDYNEEGILASCLLDFATQRSVKETGFSVTLGSISYLMVCIGEVENKKNLWDGYCGYGRNLVEATKRNRSINIYANEINSSTAMSAIMLQIMCFNKHSKITCSDSIFDNKFFNEVDLIISNPPFGISLKQEEMWAIYQKNRIPYPEYLSKRGDLFFVQQAISKLSSDGLAVMQLPMGGLFQSGKVGALRKELIENGHIKAVIQLPSGCAVGTAITTCIIVATPAQINKEIVLINASSDTFIPYLSKTGKKSFELTKEGIYHIKNIIDNKIEIEDISVCVDLNKIANMDFLLTPDAYTTHKIVHSKLYIPMEQLLEKEELLLTQINSLVKNRDEKITTKKG